MGSRRSRKRQAQLTFTPIPASSPASAEYNQQIRDRAAAVRFDGSPNPAKRVNTEPPPPPVLAPVVSSRIQTRADMSSRVHKRQTVSDSDSEPIVTSSAITRHSTGHRQFGSSPTSQQWFSSSSTFFARHQQTPSSQSKATGRVQARLSRRIAPQPQAQRVNDSMRHDSSSEEPEDLPVTPASRKRQAKHASPKSSPPVTILSDNDQTDASQPQLISHSRRRTYRSGLRSPSPESAMDSLAEEPGRKRLKLRRQKQQRDEVEADARDLQKSSGSEVRGPRSSQKTKRNARQQLLNKLKRRRAGKHSSETHDRCEDGTDQDDSDLSVIRSDDSDGNDINDEDNIEANDEPDVPISSRQIFETTQADEEFLTEDEEHDDMSDAANNLPLQFSKYASMKSRELFKFVVEWMVQKKLNPGFQQKDEIYVLAFSKLDDEVKYLAGSKFMSAAWTAPFSYALRARPQIAFTHMQASGWAGDELLRDKCDACNRSGHPATYSLQFLGNPYNQNTLEDVGDDTDDEEESGSESSSNDGPSSSPAHDAEGRTIVPEDHIFYVGKFCMSNAETAHALQHWRHHLYEWVCDWLETEGYSTPDKIVARDKWNERKRRKYVNRLVDDMESNGKVKELWKEFRQQVDQARDSKQGR